MRRLYLEDMGPLADLDDDARTYRSLAKRHHPDQVGDEREVWDRVEAARQFGLTQGDQCD